MKFKIIHQRLAIYPMYEQIKRALKSGVYNQLRVLVAYVSWCGVSLIHKELESFHDKGYDISMIIGIGEGASEPDVLRYLVQRLPHAQICLFHVPVPNFTYHPKVYVLSNNRKSLVVIGSSNFTMGGLYCNAECCVRFEFNHKKEKQLHHAVSEMWDTYAKPTSPFKRRNLRKVDEKILKVYSKVCRQKRKSLKRKRRSDLDTIFPPIAVPIPSIDAIMISKERQKKRQKRRASRRKPVQGGKTLLLQVLKETGADGTQVQIPRSAIIHYFGVSSVGHQTIELEVQHRPIRPAVICHFPNNTHRISFPEIANMRRPLLMRFISKGDHNYGVKIIRGKAYKTLIGQCTEQTRKKAKKWVIVK